MNEYSPSTSISLGLIGNTPLIRLEGFDTGSSSIFLKLESQNPGGSIKDRMAVAMIEAAEKSGRLKPGQTLVEATAGNTGIGLALVAAIKGYKLILVIPDKMSPEKIAHARALGADIRLTRSDVGPDHADYYQNLAAQIARETPGAYHINQFGNPANPLAHEQTTGPEIWDQMNHKIDAIICGVGSGGTLTGLSNYFSRVNPDIEIILADPEGSALAGYVTDGKPSQEGSYTVEGIGGSCIPSIADFSRVKKAYSISDGESFETARELLRKTGILAGSSSGTLLAAALKYAREQKTPKRIVSLICDTGAKYLSKLYNDYWMIDQGYLKRKQHGDLRDLITRRYADGAVITVGPDDPLLTAFQRMKLADVSQVPVIENGRCIGILDESDVLLSVRDTKSKFHEPVRNSMTSRLETLEYDESLDKLYFVLNRGYVALIEENGEFLGLITRADLLSFLRRQL